MRLRLLACLLLGLAGCDGADVGVPEGKLAVVGDVVLGPEDLSSTQSQLGAYAQLRFSGDEGQRALLEALVAAELLAQEAIDHDLGDDPRVQWALYEEIAEVFLRAEIERRVPRETIASDEPALQAWIDAHPDDFAIGERRQARLVVFTGYDEAEAALARLTDGEVTLDELGDVVTTPLQERDDAEHPGFHAILFTPSLTPDDPLPAPVVLGQVLAIGELAAIEAPTTASLADPVVHERVVEAVAGPRREAARAELLGDLATRFPVQPP